MSIQDELRRFHKAYPLQRAEIERKEFFYRYHRGGEITIVLFTGGIGKTELFWEIFQSLSSEYSVLAFDYQEGYATCRELTDAVAALLTRIGSERNYLFGQSYGGLMAQVLAKNHPEAVEGLILTNTGTLARDMGREGKEGMEELIRELQQITKVLRHVPLGLIKSALWPMVNKKLAGYSQGQKEYVAQFVRVLMEELPVSYVEHVCGLVLDLKNCWDHTPEDFVKYRGKVLLMLSEKDTTFNCTVKKALEDIMPEPVVRRDISGGHLAMLLETERYVRVITEFLTEKG
ncbi:alpha/beta hydrolase [Lactonifactor longoviformis]|uniref:Pimeloyl-ACP methyl ester carboxylesterase n=1 Tax=Lactonifactor longoviformis DSM 17459 TaxID=1122155 RepID=A0A1M4YAB3_9CLOT|nr:alpha/beta hydrolase [Lactonifactor longoviformis]POP32416.1 alpha/beta hydrolase [Lactonifactor longoviformis]SHF02655.1 Pimeloyl-ACP methyl ester carboxylesterase [Lactonifactor longoviformis DSM 17459]